MDNMPLHKYICVASLVSSDPNLSLKFPPLCGFASISLALNTSMPANSNQQSELPIFRKCCFTICTFGALLWQFKTGKAALT